MAKKIKTVLKIDLDAGRPNPADVGKTLGMHGVNPGAFMAAYTEETKGRIGDIIPAEVTVYEDRSFTFVLKTPPTAFLLRKAARVSKGAERPGSEGVGSITQDELLRIAKTKMPDLNAYDLDTAAKIIAGTARSMGIAVV